MWLFSGLLGLLAIGCNAQAEFRPEGAGLGTGDEAAQVGHRVAAHGMGLQSASLFVQKRLGLLATALQQLSGRFPFRRQHLLRKDQITTTTIQPIGQRAGRMRLASRVLWLY